MSEQIWWTVHGGFYTPRQHFTDQAEAEAAYDAVRRDPWATAPRLIEHRVLMEADDE